MEGCKSKTTCRILWEDTCWLLAQLKARLKWKIVKTHRNNRTDEARSEFNKKKPLAFRTSPRRPYSIFMPTNHKRCSQEEISGNIPGINESLFYYKVIKVVNLTHKKQNSKLPKNGCYNNVSVAICVFLCVIHKQNHHIPISYTVSNLEKY